MESRLNRTLEFYKLNSSDVKVVDVRYTGPNTSLFLHALCSPEKELFDGAGVESR